ncbi:hypothetical protein OsI_22622 [Oryza sativa Indica Group]|uniref:Uncharacterized protein n=2 Tax=Oryza sativa TaxID=4530 RepID=B9FSU6_ORYSJ|nr:hypothetical protein OsI_22622 [Oryza sativa Indica Group]EEE65557.1 hypothetical protein OsJ_21044 [Oryza sativa Japonica Group]
MFNLNFPSFVSIQGDNDDNSSLTMTNEISSTEDKEKNCISSKKKNSSNYQNIVEDKQLQSTGFKDGNNEDSNSRVTKHVPSSGISQSFYQKKKLTWT